MWQALNTEIELAAWRIRREHGADTTTVACLVQVTDGVFDHHAQAHRVDLEPLLSAQRECIDAWLDARGLTWVDVDAARRALGVAAAAVKSSVGVAA